MSTFRRRFAVIVDGEKHELTSRPADFLGAERDLAFEEIKNPSETAPLHLQFRIVWRMWRREFPQDAAAHDFAKFVEVVDEIEDLEVSEPLTPTPPAGSGSSP